MIHSTSTARLLLVDDEVSNLCLLQNILNRMGYRAIEMLTDSRETFNRIESFQPDLLVLDLNMPHLDGYTIMQQLGKRPDVEFIPVLILTADATPHAKRRALAAGASDLLTKPFDTSEAIMRIRNLLEMRALHRQLRDRNESLEVKVAERTVELREAQRQIVAQERLRAFSEMAGGVVHDFNNALMSIIGYSEILLQDSAMRSNPDIVQEFLTIMNTAGRDAAHVVGRLRDSYRPREDSDVFLPVELNKILEEVVPLTQPKWRDQALASGRVISLDFDLANIPNISGNAHELREVATNLIFNAVDAMPAGGAITLRTRRDGEHIIWEVQDTGTGMTEEVRARCLEPFFSTKGEKGTGLGLSMVFGIIQRHEGQVEIESAVGQGTIFKIRFPATLNVFKPAPEKKTLVGRPLRVLVVDDEPVNRDILSKYLSSDGHSVVTSGNAQEAMERFRAEHFDLVVTDHAMPGMSGLQLAADVRQLRASQPIILVTGFSDPTGLPGEMAEYVNLVISKPVPQSELRRAVAEARVPIEGAAPKASIPKEGAVAETRAPKDVPISPLSLLVPKVRVPEVEARVPEAEACVPIEGAAPKASVPKEGAAAEARVPKDVSISPLSLLVPKARIPEVEARVPEAEACDPMDGALAAPKLS
jgi:signal transduction histidine kinase